MKQLFFYEFMGIDFYHTAYSFFIYGCGCWLMECIFESIRNKKLIWNRGFNKGPICTMYGVAFLFLYFVMKPLDGHWIWLYIAGTVFATVFEYIVGCLLEKLFHQKLWDYSDFPLNFHGRVCLFISLAWGLLVVLFFAVFQPAVMGLIDRIPVGIGYPLIWMLIVIYFTDLTFSFITRGKMAAREKEEQQEAGKRPEGWLQ